MFRLEEGNWRWKGVWYQSFWQLGSAGPGSIEEITWYHIAGNFGRCKFSYTVEPHYSEPLKCGHLVLTDVLLQYGLHSHKQPYIITLERQTPRYSVKQTSSLVPLVPGLYIVHWIMWTLTCLSRKLVCHGWLIQQLNIIIALVRIVLASGKPFSQANSKGEL